LFKKWHLSTNKVEFQPTGNSGKEAYEGDYFRDENLYFKKHEKITFILVFSIAIIIFDYIYLQYFIPFLMNVLGNYFWVLLVMLF